jgi:DNA-binding SARP family transcriptional activator
MAKKNQNSLNAAVLDLTTLGRVSLDCTDEYGRVTHLLGPGKPLALIVYIRAAPQRSVHRDALLDLLWPDLEPEAARHALRQTIWSIRRRIGDDIVTTQNGALGVVG